MARRMLALFTALVLVTSLTLAAFAGEYDLNEGSVTIKADENGQTVKHGEKAAVTDASPTITGGGGTQSIKVEATGDNQAKLTIKDVKAETIEVGSSNATINVEGDNKVGSSSSSSGSGISTKSDAGIHVSSGNLTITGNGTLEVKSGDLNNAAIGSNYQEEMSGTITIGDNVNVIATGTEGAAIGSGNNGAMSGSITIKDNANVNATGTEGAGIGSGNNGAMSGSITIEDNANVTATAKGDKTGAAIGSGKGQLMSGSITIEDNANVTATVDSTNKREGAAAIGSGSNAGVNGEITIGGTSQVKAEASGGGAAIGSSGQAPMSGSITIDDNANVTATSNGFGAGIGSGAAAEMSGKITIGGTSQVTADSSENNNPGAGIGSGGGTTGGTMSGNIAISTKATVEASSIGAGGGGTMTGNGTIQYFDPPEDSGKDTKTTALYRVVDDKGISTGYKSELKEGVLTITVARPDANLTGTLAGLKTLTRWSVETIVFETESATSTFTLADLIAQGEEKAPFRLTHKGEEVTLTLNGEPLENILK